MRYRVQFTPSPSIRDGDDRAVDPMRVEHRTTIEAARSAAIGGVLWTGDTLLFQRIRSLTASRLRKLAGCEEFVGFARDGERVRVRVDLVY